MELAQGTLGYQLVVSWHATDGKEHNLAVTWHIEDVLGFYFFGGRARVEQVLISLWSLYFPVYFARLDRPWSMVVKKRPTRKQELNLGTQSEQVCISDKSF